MSSSPSCSSSCSPSSSSSSSSCSPPLVGPNVRNGGRSSDNCKPQLQPPEWQTHQPPPGPRQPRRRPKTMPFLILLLLFLLLSITFLRMYILQFTTCQKMLQWGVQVGHKERGDELQTGCALESESTTYIDIASETITPQELVRRIQQSHGSSNSSSSDDGDDCNAYNSYDNNGGNIPRILHQSYKSTLIPDRIVPFVRSWHIGLTNEGNKACSQSSRSSTSSSLTNSNSNSTWTNATITDTDTATATAATTTTTTNGGWWFVWWTDDDLQWLMETYYSQQYVKAFTKMPHPIMKADTARYFILHQFGGIYADMDIEYKPLTAVEETTTTTEVPSITQDLAALPTTTTATDRAFVFHRCEDNSLLASTPNSTFFQHVHQAWYNAATAPVVVDGRTIVSNPNQLLRKRSVHQVSGVDMLGTVCQHDQNQTFLDVVNYAPYDIHHGVNGWRWKSKRDDILYMLDIVIGVLICMLFCVRWCRYCWSCCSLSLWSSSSSIFGDSRWYYRHRSRRRPRSMA